MKTTEHPPMANVAPARKPITKPRDLLSLVEGRHVAILVRRFGEHTYQDEEGPTPTADVSVVDIEADPPQRLAEITISWRRVVAALRLAKPGTWQVGRLVREQEYQAVELIEPGDGCDLDRAAAQLGELEAARADEIGSPEPAELGEVPA
jgi:hypothetical protein